MKEVDNNTETDRVNDTEEETKTVDPEVKGEKEDKKEELEKENAERDEKAVVVINNESDEPKRRVWPLFLVIILLLGIIAFLVWFIFSGMLSKDDDKDRDDEKTESSETVSDSESSIYIDESDAAGDESIIVDDDSLITDDESSIPDEELENPELTGYEKALQLIVEEKYEEAYKELYAIKDDADAAKLLKCFKVVPTKMIQNTTAYDFKHVHEYSYDSYGNLMKDAMDGYHFIDYVYDDNHRLIQSSESRVSGTEIELGTIWVYAYDSYGNLLTECLQSNDGTIAEKTEYLYDEKQNLIREYTQSIQFGDSSCEYYYDDKGKLIQTVNRYSSGTIIACEYSYNEKGHLIKTLETDSRDSDYISTYEYSYDEHGRVIIESHNDASFTYYSYDENGNILKDISVGDEPTRYYNYTYDEWGNLLKVVDCGAYTDFAPDICEYSDFVYFYVPAE